MHYHPDWKVLHDYMEWLGFIGMWLFFAGVPVRAILTLIVKALRLLKKGDK